jgi:glutathione S-transferase
MGCAEDVLNTLEIAVAGKDYLLGDRFSAADVYLGAHLGWGMQLGTIEKRPSLESYTSRILRRPARLRADEIDNALMPPQPQAATA